MSTGFTPDFDTLIEAAHETLDDLFAAHGGGEKGVSPLRAAYGPWNADRETWRDAVPEDGPVFPEPAAGVKTFLRTVTVNVLPIHIVNGVPGNVYIDPVGLAIKDAVPFSRQARISTVDIAFTIGTPKNDTVEHVRYVVETPAEVAAWVTRFDAKKDVRPFSFTLSWSEAE